MAARLPGAFCDEIFAGEVTHLAVELDLVAGNRSGVYDANRHILKGQILDESDGVSFDGALSDRTFAKLRLRGPGQLLPVHFKIVSIVLHADLGIDGGGPLAGHAGGERRGAHAARTNSAPIANLLRFMQPPVTVLYRRRQ